MLFYESTLWSSSNQLRDSSVPFIILLLLYLWWHHLAYWIPSDNDTTVTVYSVLDHLTHSVSHMSWPRIPWIIWSGKIVFILHWLNRQSGSNKQWYTYVVFKCNKLLALLNSLFEPLLPLLRVYQKTFSLGWRCTLHDHTYQEHINAKGPYWAFGTYTLLYIHMHGLYECMHIPTQIDRSTDRQTHTHLNMIGVLVSFNCSTTSILTTCSSNSTKCCYDMHYINNNHNNKTTLCYRLHQVTKQSKGVNWITNVLKIKDHIY